MIPKHSNCVFKSPPLTFNLLTFPSSVAVLGLPSTQQNFKEDVFHLDLVFVKYTQDLLWTDPNKQLPSCFKFTFDLKWTTCLSSKKNDVSTICLPQADEYQVLPPFLFQFMWNHILKWIIWTSAVTSCWENPLIILLLGLAPAQVSLSERLFSETDFFVLVFEESGPSLFSKERRWFICCS